MPNTPVQAAGEAMPSEMICDRVERLSYELSEALAEWNNGSFMGMIYPSGHPMGVHYKQVGASAVNRLATAAEAYQRCAREVDPTATEWWELRSPDDSLVQRFVLIGAREKMPEMPA
jgi:hypothetical protein